MEATYMSSDRWMENRSGIYTILNHKQEWNTSIRSNMDGPRDDHIKWSKRKTYIIWYHLSVQFSSVTQSCPTICELMNWSTPGLPVHHQLLGSTPTHAYWVSDAIQLSHPLPSPSPPALNLSQHQGLFKWVSSLHEVAKVLEFQLQHQSFQWTPRIDLL